MKLSELFNSKFLSPEELISGPKLVTIIEYRITTINPNSREVGVIGPVLYFKELPKGLVLTKALAYELAAIWNSADLDDWLAKKFILGVIARTYRGKKVYEFEVRAPERK